jgi:hypothetical protein
MLVTTLALAAIASSTNAADIQRQVQVAGSTIDVSVSGELPVSEAALFRWVETSARGVAEYLGRLSRARASAWWCAREGGAPSVTGVTYGGRFTLHPHRRRPRRDRAGRCAPTGCSRTR